jgi:hypothetical protein
MRMRRARTRGRWERRRRRKGRWDRRRRRRLALL